MSNIKEKISNTNTGEKLILLAVVLRLMYPTRAIFTAVGKPSLYHLTNYGVIFSIFLYYIYQCCDRQPKISNILNEIKILFKKNFYLLPLFIYISLYSLKVILFKDISFEFYSSSSELINYFNLLIALLIGVIVYRNRSTFFSKILINCAFFSIMVTIIYSIIYFLAIDPLAARRGNAVALGVADFSMVYTVVFMPLFFQKYREKIYLFNSVTKEVYIKTQAVLIWIITLVFLIKSGYMIAVLLTMYSIFLIILFDWVKLSFKKVLLVHLILIVSIIILRIPIGNFLLFISNKFEKNWVIQKKIIAISNLFTGKGSEFDTLFDRFALTQTSLKGFFKYPIFGIPFNLYNPSYIGNHTQWFDDLARMGLLSIVYGIFLCFYYIKNVKHSDFLSKITFYIYVVLGFLNPVLMSPLTLLVFGVAFVEPSSNSSKDSLVTVIIPSYNSGKTILSTVKSVVNQTYTNLEIIIIDDGSTDKPVAEYEKILTLDSRIKILYKENGGVSSARNFGISNANGEYICFLDSDDLYDERFIELTLNDESDVSFCSYSVIGEYSEEPQVSLSGVTMSPESLLFDYLSRKILIHTSNWIIRTNILLDNGIKFNEKISWSEDILFFSEVLICSQKISREYDFLTYYRDDNTDNRLSEVSINRLCAEVFALDTLNERVIQSPFSYIDKNKINRLIYQYRLPATIFYTFKQLDFTNMDYDDLNIYKQYLFGISSINGLRSLKLKLMIIRNSDKLL